MRNRSKAVGWRFSIVSTLVAQAVYATQASAQIGYTRPTRPTVSRPAGFYLTPSLTLREGYDDNIQSAPQGSPEKEGDYIFRTEPGLIAGYQSAPFSLLAGYRIAADVYAQHSDFNSFPSRQDASLTADYLPNPLLDLNVTGGFQQSEYAGQLNSVIVSDQTGLPATGIENGRSRTELYYAGSSVSYELSPLNRALAGYSFVHSDQVGASTDNTHAVDATFSHRFSEVDAGDLGYIYRHFSSSQTGETSAEPPPDNPAVLVLPTVSDSNAVTLGWTHRFSELTEVVLRAGPRFSSDGGVNAEAYALISRTLARGSARFEYVRSQTSAVGVGSSLDVQSFDGSLEYDLLESLTTLLHGGFYQTTTPADTTGSSDITDVWIAGLSARYRLLEWLSIVLDYSFSYQDGVLFTLDTTSSDTVVARSNGNIYRNIISIGLEATQPFRVY